MKSRIHADGYSEAIPIDDLVRIAQEDAQRCGAQSADEIRRCAYWVVLEKLCPCTASLDQIVDKVVEEFQRQIRGTAKYTSSPCMMHELEDDDEGPSLKD
jgi:hypothetical protein